MNTRTAIPALGALTFTAAFAAAACNPEVQRTSSSSGTDGGGSAATSGSTSTTTTTSSGTGGTGGGPVLPIPAGPLGAPQCGPAEGMMVVTANSQSTQVATTNPSGAWQTPVTFDGAYTVAAYLTNDVFTAFWSDGQMAHTAQMGPSPQVVDQTDWLPAPSSKISSVGGNYLISNTYQPHPVALLGFDHPDLFAPIPGAENTVLDSISVVPGDVITAVGQGPNQALCDMDFDGDNEWSPAHCRDDIKIYLGSEIPLPPPAAVRLQNGDLAVVFHDSEHAGLSVTYQHAGTWSPAINLDPGGLGLNFAAAASKQRSRRVDRRHRRRGRRRDPFDSLLRKDRLGDADHRRRGSARPRANVSQSAPASAAMTRRSSIATRRD